MTELEYALREISLGRMLVQDKATDWALIMILKHLIDLERRVDDHAAAIAKMLLDTPHDERLTALETEIHTLRRRLH